MEPDKRTEEQRSKDRVACFNAIQAEALCHEPDDVAWACLLLAGHTVALCAEDDPERFARNIETAKGALYASAEETFGGDLSEWNARKATERACDAPLA